MGRETALVVSVSLATAILGAFQAQLPPLHELRDTEGTDGDPTLRGTEAQVAGLAIAAGLVLSIVTRSSWPALTAGGVVGLQLAQYEWGIRG